MLMVNRMKEGIKTTYIYIWYENPHAYYFFETSDAEEQIISKLEEHLNWMCQLNNEQVERLLPRLFKAHRDHKLGDGYSVYRCAMAEMDYIDCLRTNRDELKEIIG